MNYQADSYLQLNIAIAINLLSACARKIADSTAARKQAEGAHRHLEQMMSQETKVKISLESK